LTSSPRAWPWPSAARLPLKPARRMPKRASSGYTHAITRRSARSPPSTRSSPRSGIGLGLGLYIAREIVERHGGFVTLSSAPGEGSTFTFTIPLSTPPDPCEA
jgi:light-regulated signal transduction histidine kinase (bacteriophytochrome)